MHYEIDENGRIRTQDFYYSSLPGMEWNECRFGYVVSRTTLPTAAGSVYYTPGYTNGGWPNLLESTVSNWFGIDGDGDGRTDLTCQDYGMNGKPAWQNTHLFPDTDRLCVMAYGQYTFEGEMNSTPY